LDIDVCFGVGRGQKAHCDFKYLRSYQNPGAPLAGHQHSRTPGLMSQRERGVVAAQVDSQPFLTPCCIPELVHRALSASFSEREGPSSVQTGTHALENIPDVHICAAGKLEEDLVHPKSKQVPCGQLC